MARTKHQQHHQQLDEEAAEISSSSSYDGLEIISIGSLYNGAWDKKYWSSSRGKDRYPYPVGYEARRAYNGGTYKMEINEGPKGPLFVIMGDDGYSCSGQTPDIVWGKFQKKCSPRVRVWQGKRLSCKIGGMEFFGFKNPLVQRLLRELVANINGIPEHRVSGFSTEAPVTHHSDGCMEAQTSIESLTTSTTPEVTGKTSMERDGVKENTKSLDIAGCKRPRPEDPPEDHKQECSLSAYCDLPMKKIIPAVEEGKLANCENGKFADVVSDSSAKDKPLDRSQDNRLEVPRSMEDEAGNASASKYSQGIHDVDLCAPHTFDFALGYSDSAPSTWGTDTCAVKEDLTVRDAVISEGLGTECLPQEVGTSDSNVSYEYGDFDSADQEVTRSMMALLLPQAIPLLKKKLSKKKKITHVSEEFPSTPNLHKVSNENSCIVKAQSPNTDRSIAPSSEYAKSVIPNSFDDDKYGHHAMNEAILASNDGETMQSNVVRGAYPSESMKQVASLEVKKSYVCHAEISGCKDIFCHDETQLALSKIPQDIDRGPYDSVLTSMSGCNKVFSNKTQDVCKNLDDNALPSKICCDEKDLRHPPDFNEATATSKVRLKGTASSMHLSMKDDSVVDGGNKTNNALVTQVPKRVYARKKLPNPSSTKRQHNVPFSESIICRNFKDGKGPETKGILIDSGTHRSTFYVDKTLETNCLGEETGSGRQLHGPEKTAISSIPPSESVLPLGSLPQAHVHDTSKLFPPSQTQNEKPVVHFEESEVACKNISEGNGIVPPQQQELEFCSYNTSSTHKFPDNFHLNLPKDLELTNELKGMVQLIGCYFHPMPVLSLLLSSNEKEIYVCTMCGFPADKKRVLFFYKLTTDENKKGQPSFVGYSTMDLPSLNDTIGKEVAFERSGLQLVTDGQCIALLSTIKTPYCREGRIDCLCSVCTSHSVELNAVKIVLVKDGYVSVLVQLRTVDSVQCILVCEPNHLVAAEESGKLHVWSMNSTWSSSLEEFVISANNYICPYIVELKRIPECASLIVGHDGFGEFTVWDIYKRIFISRFAAPGCSVNHFFPVSIFCWQREFSGLNRSNVEEHINRITNATKHLFSEHRMNSTFPPITGDDIAIWLLVSTASDCDAQHDYVSSNCQLNPVGCWRLALLVKNTLILGSELDQRAAAIGTSSGRGIMGTVDGLVSMWELSTGNKLGTLHHFKGESVLCIATDDSRSGGVLAIAGEKGQLLVYQHS